MPVTIADPTSRKHNASMANILVRDVPTDVHEALLQNAQHNNQSLQQYLTTELTRLATHRPMDVVLDEVERTHGGVIGFDTAVEDLAAERSGQPPERDHT